MPVSYWLTGIYLESLWYQLELNQRHKDFQYHYKFSLSMNSRQKHAKESKNHTKARTKSAHQFQCFRIKDR